MLQDLDLLREIWGKPLVVNNWHNGGHYKESGLRCNRDSLVKTKTEPYMSGHILGCAFDVKPLKIADVPNLYLTIIDNYKKFKVLSLIEDIRNAPTWCHIDCLIDKQEQIKVFK